MEESGFVGHSDDNEPVARLVPSAEHFRVFGSEIECGVNRLGSSKARVQIPPHGHVELGWGLFLLSYLDGCHGFSLGRSITDAL